MSDTLCCFQPQLESVGVCAALCAAPPPSATCGCAATSTVTVTARPGVTSVVPWLLAGALGIWLLTRRR
jgi:hypothetical protein